MWAGTQSIGDCYLNYNSSSDGVLARRKGYGWADLAAGAAVFQVTADQGLTAIVATTVAVLASDGAVGARARVTGCLLGRGAGADLAAATAVFCVGIKLDFTAIHRIAVAVSKSAVASRASRTIANANTTWTSGHRLTS